MHRGLLRRVYFLHEEGTLYVCVGFYPYGNYHVLAKFGGSRITPITLIEHHVSTMLEALPVLCEAMERCELYTRKDGSFRLRSSKTHNCARLSRKSVSFTLRDLLYMMTMLHMVEAQQSQYSLAQADVTLFAFGVLGSLIFDEPTRSSNSPIP
jgi:hypothetical protein